MAGSTGGMPATAAVPRLLLLAVEPRHPSSWRLPRAFAEAGFEVAALAPPGSLIHQTRHVARRRELGECLNNRRMLVEVEAERRRLDPAWIVPCDEMAARLLAHWCRREGRRPGALPAGLAACLERSFGRLDAVEARLCKVRTLRLAREIGVSVPDERIADTPEAARQAAEGFGYPVVVKRSNSCGGNGVRVCHDDGEVAAALRAFSRRNSAVTRAREWLRGRGWWTAQLPEVTVQRHIAGTPAMSCAVAREGHALAVLCAVAERTAGEVAPATVIRFLPHEGMAAATRAMVEAFGASGFLSFDFVLDGEGRAHLLECNARPTPVLPYGARAGVDLAASLFDMMAGRPTRRAAPREARVALFPEELDRDPGSEAARTLFHGVPWDDPSMLRALLAERRRRRAEVRERDGRRPGAGL